VAPPSAGTATAAPVPRAPGPAPKAHGDARDESASSARGQWVRTGQSRSPRYTSTIGRLTDAYDGTLAVQNVSCSGAFTNGVTPGDPTPWGRDGNFRECAVCSLFSLICAGQAGCSKFGA
jgi:hypothetical protein